MSNYTNRLGIDSSGAFFIRTSQKESEPSSFKINPQGIKTKPYQPFFSAYLGTFVRTPSPPENPLTRLIADQVFSNIGNCYNTTTGIFTAPVDGQYLFNAAARLVVIPDSIDSVGLRLRIGNQTSENVHVVNKDRNRVFVLDIVQAGILKAGEIAELFIRSDHQISILELDVSVPTTHFQGELLA